jgi:hypothetical protein
MDPIPEIAQAIASPDELPRAKSAAAVRAQDRELRFGRVVDLVEDEVKTVDGSMIPR